MQNSIAITYGYPNSLVQLTRQFSHNSELNKRVPELWIQNEGGYFPQVCFDLQGRSATFHVFTSYNEFATITRRFTYVDKRIRLR